MGDAHTRLFHELLEPLLKLPLSGTQWAIIMWVARNSYGWEGRRSTSFTWGQIARDTNGFREHVSRHGRALIGRGILSLTESGEIGINKQQVIALGWGEKNHPHEKTHGCENSPQGVIENHPPIPHSERKKKEHTCQANTDFKAVMNYFSEACLNARGFKPSMNGKDARAVKTALGDSETVDNLKAIIDFFLGSKKAEEVGISLATACSAHTRNLYRSNQAKGIAALKPDPGQVAYFAEKGMA